MNVQAAALQVIASIAAITALSYIFSAAARRLGQPGVLGQVVAGIVLGPTVLGRLPGHLDAHLFPKNVLPFLTVIAQVGLVLFMFSVGYDLDMRLLRGRASTISAISSASMLLPIALGTALALTLHGTTLARVSGHAVKNTPFILFIAVSISITAFPVLADVIRERGLMVTVPGAIALASAALMDVAGWLLLAVAVMDTSKSGRFSVPVTALLLAAYAVFMFVVLRPALTWWARRGDTAARWPAPATSALAMASAWVTGELGLHVIFGAFFLGLVMPRRPDGAPDPELLHSMETAGSLLMPVFFITTGLSVDIGALSAKDLAVTAVICLAATVGKIGGGLLSARGTGLPWRESAIVGALVNTRGLTELIALDVGRQAGLLSDRLFTIMVVMALVTTAVTGPLLNLLRASTLVTRAVEQAALASAVAAPVADRA